MKRIALLSALFLGLLAMYGCKSNTSNGELMGIQDRPETGNINPFGMVYVPSGTFTIGPSDQDVNNTLVQRAKSISIQGFYMDDAEISNNEYRQFVNYVRDSIGHANLGHYIDTEDGRQIIDWSYEIDWASDSEDASALTNMYHNDDDYFGKQLNAGELIYKYKWYSWKDAASRVNRQADERDVFMKEKEVPIYPDTLCWIHDFSYSYNEPMTRNYFWHPSFDDYPVVGVNWFQANAFCAWRTKFWNDFQRDNGQTMGEDFRLPFEHEWEYAARGGLENAPYPWGGPYVRNSQGCILANFKPGRGNYPEDGGFYTVPVYSYHPNEYGLYNMSGNVAEWTSSAFFENAYSFVHDLTPDIRRDVEEDDAVTLRRKVIRGGSWKDVAYYIQTGTRHWEYADTSKSYVGFRCALTFLGRSMSDFK